jgi:nitronate monooxygenase
MLRTFLTERWGLRYPIIGAPMAYVGEGLLAHAITRGGGLGVLGVGSTTPTSFIERESAVARGADGTRFGIGLMIWAIQQRPELLDAAIAARPFLLSISFGSPAPYVERIHAAGIVIATQVNSVKAAREAAAAGVDVIVAQGTEAGGHTGHAGLLPLLQGILDAVDTPVLAAGGIATARGLAAVLAAGAQGAWVGTAFLAATESSHGAEARRRLIAAEASDTVLTSVFDRVQGIPWPQQYPGRALRNRFAERWHGNEAELEQQAATREEYGRARAAGDFDTAVIYAGEGVGLVRTERPTAEIVRDLGEGAEMLLRQRCTDLLADK